jgi:uncharacterized protein (DUF697 family)
MNTPIILPAGCRPTAEGVVYRYTAITALTGAVPIPATTAAIIAENAAMVNEIAGCFGVPISVQTVVGSMGLVGTANAVGRAVFVEGARAMGWFAGPFGVAGVSALGAATAGVQTFVLGFLAVAIAENGGQALPRPQARTVIEAARREYGQTAWDRSPEREREPIER